MTLLGFQRSDFTLRDGSATITGFNIYLAQPIPADKGKGRSVERFYVTDAKISACGFDLTAAVGKEVAVRFNRFGKIDSLAVG